MFCETKLCFISETVRFISETTTRIGLYKQSSYYMTVLRRWWKQLRPPRTLTEKFGGGQAGINPWHPLMFHYKTSLLQKQAESCPAVKHACWCLTDQLKLCNWRVKFLWARLPVFSKHSGSLFNSPRSLCTNWLKESGGDFFSVDVSDHFTITAHPPVCVQQLCFRDSCARRENPWWQGKKCI